MIRRRSFSITLLAAAVAVAAGLIPALSAREDRPESPSKPAVVPFQILRTNHMLVQARINGKGPFRLIFDLGAPFTLISNRAAERSGVVAEGGHRSLLFGIRDPAEVDTLRVGDLTAKDLPVMVMDHPLLKAMADLDPLRRPIDGIIGYTLFARYRTTIDYQAREMTFEPVDFRVANLIEELPDRIAGPKVARDRVLAPAALWGLTLGEPEGANPQGVPILSVLAGSPAAAAGLEAGDLLTTLDGRWTTSVADAYSAASGVPPGHAAEVVILRDGQEKTLIVTPRDGI